MIIDDVLKAKLASLFDLLRFFHDAHIDLNIKPSNEGWTVVFGNLSETEKKELAKNILLNGWKLVADEMPDSDIDVLVHNPGWIEPVQIGSHNGTFWFDAEGRMFPIPEGPDDPFVDDCDKPPTHWRDFPDAPKKEGV